MDRDERRRARRQHVHARPTQVKLVAHPRREEVLVVARVPDQEHPDAAHEVRVGQDVVQQVGVHATTGKHTNAPKKPLRHVPRMFERFPRALEEHTMLRIEQRCIARREPEEASIELIDALQQHRGLDVVRIGEQRRWHAERTQVLVGQFDPGLASVTEQAPVFFEVASAR